MDGVEANVAMISQDVYWIPCFELLMALEANIAIHWGGSRSANAIPPDFDHIYVLRFNLAGLTCLLS